MLNKCVVCGKEFESVRYKKCCSNKCYYHYGGYYAKKEIKHICLFCGKEFISSHDNTQFCSGSCREKYKRRENAEIRYCRTCGKELGKLVKGQVYCSSKCKQIWQKKNPKWTKVCLVCNNEFKTNDKRQKYCSRKCQHASMVTTGLNATCINCGTQFHGYPERANRFCSRKCFIEYTGIVELKKYKYESDLSDATAIKRAKKYGVQYENIDPLEIYERDNWICGICGEPIDKRLKWPHPMSASLDHIIPLSKNGTHTKENVQASHLRCNCLKNAKVA